MQLGERIEEPHDTTCPCETCNDLQTKDELRWTKNRLGAYKGLASESYISLANPDPILSAFVLRQKLRINAKEEKHFAVSMK